ncbi:MAG: hypothetical protein WC554_01020 [Clostridia bacterium]|jgi:hypothetical protein
MQLIIKINLDNEAFFENAGEIDRILNQYVIGQIADDYDPEIRKPLLDMNGNVVGIVKITH